MMTNYLKSEWYRITRGREIYVFTGVLSLLVLAMNLILYGMTFVDATFPYASVHFSLSNIIANLTLLFVMAALLVAMLFADNKSNGSYKNAIAGGISRSQIFFSQCLICTLMAFISMIVVVAVLVVSAVLLLQGPIEEPIVKLLEGIGATLPSAIAAIVLAVAGFTFLSSTTGVVVFWVSIVFVIPNFLILLGTQFEFFQLLASWIPSNFLSNEVMVNMSGFDCLWNTSFGLMKCMLAGFACIAFFLAFGTWRSKRVEL